MAITLSLACMDSGKKTSKCVITPDWRESTSFITSTEAEKLYCAYNLTFENKVVRTVPVIIAEADQGIIIWKGRVPYELLWQKESRLTMQMNGGNNIKFSYDNSASLLSLIDQKIIGETTLLSDSYKLEIETMKNEHLRQITTLKMNHDTALSKCERELQQQKNLAEDLQKMLSEQYELVKKAWKERDDINIAMERVIAERNKQQKANQELEERLEAKALVASTELVSLKQKLKQEKNQKNECEEAKNREISSLKEQIKIIRSTEIKRTGFLCLIIFVLLGLYWWRSVGVSLQNI
jgi:hypothetical protein